MRVFLSAAAFLLLGACASPVEYDEYGYPMSPRGCGSENGELVCRELSRREQVELFPEHPERFSDQRAIRLAETALSLPEGARRVRECIGVFDEETYESFAEGHPEAPVCLWVEIADVEDILRDLGDQIEAQGFEPVRQGVPNAQNINPTAGAWSSNTRCERVGIAVILWDIVIEEPVKHVHLVIGREETC